MLILKKYGVDRLTIGIQSLNDDVLKLMNRRHSAEEALFADYEETIGGTEEFKSLKEKSAEFSLDALKKECLCIVGMYSMTSKAKETKKPKESLKFSVENPETENDPYGGIHAKYLNR